MIQQTSARAAIRKSPTGIRELDREALERSAADAPAAVYVLRLFVTGMTPRSTRAVEKVRAICEEYLRGRYDLEVIDIYQQPALATGEQIIAAPTLVKKLPLPLRRVIGDMSSTERVLQGLDLAPAPGR
jgi:circadian clock protein KaiB